MTKSERLADLEASLGRSKEEIERQLDLEYIRRAVGFRFDETSVHGDVNGVPYIEKPAVLFEVGEHKGYTYTEDDLDKMVASFRAPEDDSDVTLPVQLDHSSSARDTVGSVRRVWRDAGKLMGVVRVYGQEAVEKVASGVWRRLSIAHRGDLSLREVTITPFPHLAGAKMFKEGGAQMSKKQEMKKAAEPNEEEAVDSPEEEKDETPEEEAEEQKPAAKGKKHSDAKKAACHSEEAGDDRQFAELESRFSEMFERRYGARIAELEAAKNQLERERRFRACEDLVMQFGDTGKTTPAMAATELQLVQTFSDEQLALYRKLKDAQPAVVTFGRISKPSVQKPGQEFGAEEMTAEVKRLADVYAPKTKA